MLPSRPLVGLRAGSHLGNHARNGSQELAAEGELHHHRDRALGVGRRGQRQIDVHVICGIACIIDMADERLGDDRNVAVPILLDAHDLPCDGGQMRGNAAEDFAVEELDDLRDGAASTRLCRR